jgi:hypothetical protein
MKPGLNKHNIMKQLTDASFYFGGAEMMQK